MKQETLQVFDIGMSLISDLKKKLSEYSKDNNAGDKQFMQGYTFNTSIQYFSELESKLYNRENRALIQQAPEDSKELPNIFSRIDQNNKHLFEIETQLNVFFKDLN